MKKFYMLFDPGYTEPGKTLDQTHGPRKRYETLAEAEDAARGIARKSEHAELYILEAVKVVYQSKPVEIRNLS